MHAAHPELAAAAARLQMLVAEGRFAEAADALAQYGLTVENAAQAWDAGDSRRIPLAEDGRRLMDELRRQVLARRSHLQARLAQLPKPVRGYTPAPQAGRTLELTG